MDTITNLTIDPTGSMSGSIDLPAIPKEAPKKPWFTTTALLRVSLWIIVAIAVGFWLRAAARWLS